MANDPKKPVVGDGGGPRLGQGERLSNRGPDGRQLPFIPTDEQRIQVRAWASALLELKHIAAKLGGIDVQTVKKHFETELAEGEADCIASISAKYVRAALDGDRKAMRNVLEKKGGWNGRMEHTGPGGGPIKHEHMSESEVDARLRELEQKHGPVSDAMH